MVDRCCPRCRELEIHGHAHLGGPWAGWRLAGRELVSPGRQRIGPRLLEHLIWHYRVKSDVAQKRESRRLEAVRREAATVVQFLRPENYRPDDAA